MPAARCGILNGGGSTFDIVRCRRRVSNSAGPSRNAMIQNRFMSKRADRHQQEFLTGLGNLHHDAGFLIQNDCFPPPH